MKRIGLTQRLATLKDRNERRECLDQAWSQLLAEIEMLAVPLSNRATDTETIVSELKLEGIILTGGNDLSHLPGAMNTAPERDDFEHKLLDVCSERKIPVLGVCRGLQMIVTHYGGKVTPVKGHVATYHGLAVLRRDIMPLSDREKVNSFHNFGITKENIASDLTVIATAPDGTIEAAAHRKFSQWGIMWHPERPPHDEEDKALIRKIFK